MPRHLPSPPKHLGTITYSRLHSKLYLLHIGGFIGVMDREYKLTSKEECERFLRWYRSNHPYTKYWNCETFAWMMRAKALEWGNGEFIWGWIWGEGIDENYQFLSHGWNWIMDYREDIYFCDELEVAAPRDKCEEFYMVKNYCMIG